MSDEELQELYLYHSEILDFADKEELEINFDVGPIPLYEYEVRTIIYYRYKHHCDSFELKNAKGKWSIEYCMYKNDDLYAVYVDYSGSGHVLSPYTETVNGLEFVYHDSKIMLIYQNGSINMVSDAFESGSLTNEMLAELHKSYWENYDQYAGPLGNRK